MAKETYPTTLLGSELTEGDTDCVTGCARPSRRSAAKRFSEILSFSIVAVLAFAGNANAGTVAPRKASEIITLSTPEVETYCPNGGLKFSVANNSLSSVSFASGVPERQAFVVTEVDWARCNQTPDSLVAVRLTSGAGFDLGDVRAILYATAAPNGCAGGTTQLSGAVFRSGEDICLDTDFSIGPLNLQVHGFLIRSR